MNGCVSGEFDRRWDSRWLGWAKGAVKLAFCLPALWFGLDAHGRSQVILRLAGTWNRVGAAVEECRSRGGGDYDFLTDYLVTDASAVAEGVL